MISGHLFTRDFLLEGIDREADWLAIDEDALVKFTSEIRRLAAAMAASSRPNESDTEQRFIYPVLNLLGWQDRLQQQTASVKGRKQVPDALLLPSEDALNRASAEPDEWKRYRHGTVIVEAKRWKRILDRAGGVGAETKETVPSTQMLQYLNRIDVTSNGAIKLGILTNGCVWRLYSQNTLSVAEEYLEIDLAKALDLPGHPLDLFDADDTRLTQDRALRVFYLLFGKPAFLSEGAEPSLHERARETGRVWEEKVTDELSDLVFETLFPRLVTQLAEHDPERQRPASDDYLQEVQAAALILLYRLLFVVYAEDRDLLPDAQEPYKSYSLTHMRLDIADKKDRGEFFSSKQATYWPRLKTIFRAIADGDNELGIPPYNGGLFARRDGDLLERVELPDAVLSDLIYDLSHRMEEGQPRYINYRDLTVQHLGSIYERILDYRLIEQPIGIVVDEDHAARHISGSYYTPDSLVMLIIEKAVGPLVEERLEAFRERNEALRDDPRPEIERVVELKGLDPAQALLRLKVCDPAMGSGHFLVSLVDWLADRVLAAIAEAEAAVDWSDEPYRSPVSRTIEHTRDAILEHAVQNKWPYVSDQLDDRHIVRRAVLKRCVYGVDRNPMAVELAKVSLWLHTFTVGAPLSFLDHHLYCGNSLIGEWIRPAMDQLAEWGSPLLMGEAIKHALTSAEFMRNIEATSDADIGQVLESKRLFADVELRTAPLIGLLNFMNSARQVAGSSKLAKVALEHLTRGDFGDPVKLITGEAEIAVPDEAKETELERQKRDAASGHKSTLRQRAEEAVKIIAAAREHLAALKPFHWQVPFIGVWQDWGAAGRNGGFDAVIGNPPYVRQELIKDQKPTLKKTYPDVYDGYADLYVYFYAQGLRLLRPGGRLSYVVTNKWFRAGYASGLRKMFARDAWVEFVADFGHAKHLFPDADVFPCVIVLRNPCETDPPVSSLVSSIPRDLVPRKGLSAAVAEFAFSRERLDFGEENWVVESEPVVYLYEKMRGNTVGLGELLGSPNYGLKTGLNEAFLVGDEVRERMMAKDAKSSDLLRPYFRGEDISRWSPEWDGRWIITLKSSENTIWPWSDATSEHEAESLFERSYPAVFEHFKRYESWTDQSGNQKGLRHRSDQGRFWWELRSCSYYENFEADKIIYQVIQYHSRFAFDTSGGFGNDKTFILPTNDKSLLAVLNSPIMWWHNWRYLPHMKDEALSPMGFLMERLPIPQFSDTERAVVSGKVDDICARMQRVRDKEATFSEWLKLTFDLEKLPMATERLARLSETDALATALSAFPRKSQPGAADLVRIKKQVQETISPAHTEWFEIQSLERELSDLVNAAFGLTEEDVALMWRTAPPRMPFYPK